MENIVSAYNHGNIIVVTVTNQSSISDWIVQVPLWPSGLGDGLWSERPGVRSPHGPLHYIGHAIPHLYNSTFKQFRWYNTSSCTKKCLQLLNVWCESNDCWHVCYFFQSHYVVEMTNSVVNKSKSYIYCMRFSNIMYLQACQLKHRALNSHEILIVINKSWISTDTCVWIWSLVVQSHSIVQYSLI